MNEVTVQFRLNTALAALDEMGAFKNDEFRELVLPLRGQIMQHDGLVGCSISRYNIEVKYLRNVTDVETIDKIVQDAVQWASEQQDFFPLRGVKTPSAVIIPTIETTEEEILIDFSSYVVGFPPSPKAEKFNMEKFRYVTHHLAEAMTNTDGVTSFQLRIQSARITYDARFNTREKMIKHLRLVFENAANGEIYPPNGQGEYFPFLEEDELEVEFSS